MPITRVRISTRTAAQAGEPILCKLAKNYEVVVNLRRAQVTEESGLLEIDIEGAIEDVDRAIAWLQTTGLSVSALDRCVADGSNL